jgi:hypothetical protein
LNDYDSAKEATGYDWKKIEDRQGLNPHKKVKLKWISV